MASKPYVVFTLHGRPHAVDVACVREVFWLPELQPVEETPSWIAGLLNYRGRIIAVMDLDLRFGRIPPAYCLTDGVIVIEFGGSWLGIIVNEVIDVRDIPDAAIETAYLTSGERTTHSHLVSGEARVGNDIVVLLNPENVVRHAREFEEEENGGKTPLLAAGEFCPGATPEQRAVFHERAGNLADALEEPFLPIHLAVVGLNGEYFGIGLEAVREFVCLREAEPIPCCPAHIAGGMNLRGNILVLVDIRELLGLSSGGLNPTMKVVVASTGEITVGVAVDEVFDIVYQDPAGIVATPAALRNVGGEYLRGAAPYGGRIMTILDLQKILGREELVVNDVVC